MPIDLVLLQSVALLSMRCTIFTVFAPPFNHTAIPMRVRAMLGLGLGLALSAGQGLKERLSDSEFIFALAAEAATGFLVALLIALVFAAFQMAGALIDVFGGFQIAQAFDPSTGINGAQFSRLFHFAALVLMFTSGAYQVLFAGLFRTLEAVPLGAFLDLGASARSIVDASTNLLLAGAQIAAPMVIVLLLADVGLGLVTRAAPALNAFVLGFPLKMLISIVFIGAVFGLFPALVGQLTEDAIELIRAGVRADG